MNKSLLISAVILFTFTGIRASINPFKPYKPLNKIDYQLNLSLGRDTASMAYRPDRFIERTLLPLGLLSTSILYNDNYLDKRIIKLGRITQPALQSANILQYSPAGIMLLLKAAGVKGRSDWPRMITADGAAVAIQAGITNALKYTLRRERPDGRANNSYPSGHTATAFMCAHMLHKEYGETMSPWISVGGYGIAATTGIFRVMPEWKFSLYSDYSMGADVFTSGGYGNPDAKPACSIGIDASWMPWYIGPTLRAGLTQMKWTGSDDIYLAPEGSVADVYTLAAGMDIDIPVFERIMVNGQALAGYSPRANSYSFFADPAQGNPLEWTIPAGVHCYGNLGLTVRTSSFSSVSVHGGLDYYDKVWRSFVLGASFNFCF